MSRNGLPTAYDPLVRAAAHALRHRCGVRPGQHLLLAVSGGCDSVAMLRAVAILAARRGWDLRLTVGHVQHHLRQQAEGDAGFTAELAGRLGLAFVRADLDLAEQPPAGELRNLESRARKARYQALTQMAQQVQAQAVVTAHHGDDQLETVVMRLLRGASVRGLAGMAWRRRLDRQHPIDLLRPLLGVDRQQVVAFLQRLGQVWREDHTNRDVTRLRARLRQEVLPVFKQIAPQAARQAVRLGSHLRDVDHALHQAITQARQAVTVQADAHVLPRQQARQWPRAVLWGLLRLLLIEHRVPADRLGDPVLGPIVRAIRDQQGGQRTFDLPGGCQITMTALEVTIQQGRGQHGKRPIRAPSTHS